MSEASEGLSSGSWSSRSQPVRPVPAASGGRVAGQGLCLPQTWWGVVCACIMSILRGIRERARACDSGEWGGCAFTSDRQSSPKRRKGLSCLQLCSMSVLHMGAVESSALSVAVCAASCVHVMCVSVHACVICAQLCCWLNLQTRKWLLCSLAWHRDPWSRYTSGTCMGEGREDLCGSLGS